MEINGELSPKAGVFMRAHYLALAGIAVTSLSGCTHILGRTGLPKTLGEQASNYGYVPLDPLPIDETKCNETGKYGSTSIPPSPLTALPDFAVRLAISSTSGSAGPKYGPVALTVAGNHYKVVMDYINADVVPMTFLVTRWDTPIDSDGIEAKPYAPSTPTPKGEKVLRYQVEYAPPSNDARPAPSPSQNDRGLIIINGHLNSQSYFVERYTFPVYVGIGLRLTADIQAIKGGVNITGLSTIGLAADANKVTGSLTVQTLGVNGKTINIALPNTNKLDQSTIENAVLAMGSMRALMYTADATDAAVRIEPRVVGLYSPLDPDPTLINAIYSSLALSPPRWIDPCPGKTLINDVNQGLAVPKPAVVPHGKAPTKGKESKRHRTSTTKGGHHQGTTPSAAKIPAEIDSSPARLEQPSSSTIQAPPPPPPPE